MKKRICGRKKKVKLDLPGERYSPHWFHAGCRQYLKVEGPKFICPTFLRMNQCRIDIIKLDRWLHGQFGNYEDAYGWSMRELLAKKFSPEASRFVELAI